MSEGLIREFMFWGIWLVIPLLVDIITGIASGIIVLNGYFKRNKTEIDFLPHVTILDTCI